MFREWLGNAKLTSAPLVEAFSFFCSSCETHGCVRRLGGHDPGFVQQLPFEFINSEANM